MFHDRAPIEKVRRLGDGRIAAVAKFARSGCYDYAGSEVGRPDLAKVTVYRPDDEVFSEDAIASFAHKAITLDHPSEPVSRWCVPAPIHLQNERSMRPCAGPIGEHYEH